MASRLYAPFTLSPPARAVPALVAAVVVLGWGWSLMRLTSDSGLVEYDKNYHTQKERDSLVEDTLVQNKEGDIPDLDNSKDDNDTVDLEEESGLDLPELFKDTLVKGLDGCTPKDVSVATAFSDSDDDSSFSDLDLKTDDMTTSESNTADSQTEEDARFESTDTLPRDNNITSKTSKPASIDLPQLEQIQFSPESSLPSPESTPRKKAPRAKPKDRTICTRNDYLTGTSYCRNHYIDLKTSLNEVAYEDEFKAWLDNSEVDKELKAGFFYKAAMDSRDWLMVLIETGI
ncbi:hypothetical protein VNI00_014601 [Paramarasmius palmivorus]|uniref:Uncharacterized protein n=1 Tax=Paramarasmius palmivorus TaxID=297713 RepID=A0AAW0BRZ1_9AGAR